MHKESRDSILLHTAPNLTYPYPRTKKYSLVNLCGGPAWPASKGMDPNPSRGGGAPNKQIAQLQGITIYVYKCILSNIIYIYDISLSMSLGIVHIASSLTDRPAN